MNRLTDRLQLMADQIETGQAVADIGTDHGFLPLYLWERCISPHVIMCDISNPSLAKAREAFKNRAAALDMDAFTRGTYDFRTGDGLKIIGHGEVDAVVIAGMGGLLIREILDFEPDKTRSFRKLVLQPRNNAGQLRYWLATSGFEITDNILVREGKFICEIIVASPSVQHDEPGRHAGCPGIGSACWDFPAELTDKYPGLAREYAKSRLEIEERIHEGVMRSCNCDESNLMSVEKRIDYYKQILRA